MGATCANPAAADCVEIPEMESQYKDKRLPVPDLKAYKTPFERDFYMVVGILRDNPLSFQNYVKNYVAKGKFDGSPQAANTLIERLHTLDKLEPIQLNQSASAACYVNLTKNKDQPGQITGGAASEL